MSTERLISVKPLVLEKALRDAGLIRFDTDSHVVELRALLDAPAPCTHEWTDDDECTLTCTKCGKTETHEPYGWVQTRGNAINHFTQEWDVVESWEDQGFEYKAMFDHAEQPAPVAVVLPERYDMPHREEFESADQYAAATGEAKKWNACLDEVVRLTATVRIPERLVMTDGLHTYEYVTGHNAAIDKMLGAKSR